MKTFNKLMVILTTGVFFFSCKKVENVNLNAGVLNVTNAVVGGSVVTFLADHSIVSTVNTVSNNSAALLPIASGHSNISLIVPATLTTPLVTYYKSTLDVTSQSNYSLFLTGASPAAVESILIEEKYPRSYADSVCGVRFINLAQGNTPVSVNIKNSANGSEATSIAYKAYTDFKLYPAKRINPSYIFEFRNANTGVLISSYTLTTPYFHNVTLALRGTIGGTTGVILDNDY